MLSAPNIDVNILNNRNERALDLAVIINNVEVLKPLLSHPSLTTLTLNHKDKLEHSTPVMLAVKMNKLEQLEVLTADLRVDLDTFDKEGRSLEEVAGWVFLLSKLCDLLSVTRHSNFAVQNLKKKYPRDKPETRRVLDEAKQRREEKLQGTLRI